MNEFINRDVQDKTDISARTMDNAEVFDNENEISDCYSIYSQGGTKNNYFEYKEIAEKDDKEALSEKRQKDIEELKEMKAFLNNLHLSDDSDDADQKVLTLRRR